MLSLYGGHNGLDRARRYKLLLTQDERLLFPNHRPIEVERWSV